MGKSVAVIGSGFSGLASATCLADKGFKVDVFEKNDSLGGRARKFNAEGFTFDMGPSWYWMPDVFETYFNRFGKSVEDYFTLKRLDPSYRVFFPGDEQIDIPAGVENLIELYESLEPGSGKNLKKFLDESKYKYDVSMNDLVYKPSLSWSEYFSWKVIKGSFSLHMFRSMTRYLKKYFKDPRIIQMLEFPVLFLGAAPEKTPAMYSLMNYADMALGTWYPMGGMHKIVEAMTGLAKEKGVEFHTSTPIEQFNIEQKVIKSVSSNGSSFDADYFVAGADYNHVDQKLLGKGYSNYDDSYWSKRTMAPSSLLFYLGVNRKIDNLLHHNLFFDEDFGKHSEAIYDNPSWPDKPLFYACCPSKTDDSVAPEGMENLFLLIPVAPDIEDNEEIREKYYNIIMDRLEARTGTNIRDHVIYKRSYAHKDFKQDYNAFKGNAYGLANTLRQTAVLKPRIKSKKLSNLMYTGQLTVPGPGVPPSLISGQLVAEYIRKRA